MALFGNKQSNDKKKKKSLFGNSSSNGGGSQFSTDSLDRQISNAETRIRASGYAPVNADKRNWFEKATNLPEGQNAFFDVLDLLDRPGNAIRTAIHEKDDSNLQELWQGFSGKKKTRGTDLLDESGNKVLDGLAGFALEVVTDPTSLIPSGAIAKGIKGAGSITGKALKTIPLSNKATEAFSPAYNGIKDSLGYMFNSKYGRDKVFNESGELTQGEDILSPMLRRTDNAMSYDKMKSLENIQNAAKTAGGYNKGDVAGRIMEKDLKQFDEVGNVIPRLQRELPTDEGINESAHKLIQSNNVIRQQAEDLGISIQELDGYMRHILSKEEVKLRKQKGASAYGVDKGNYGLANPNDKFLKQRQLLGSAEDVNDQLGRKFFETNAFFSTAAGQKQLIEYMHAASLRREILSNPKLAIKWQPGMQVVNGTVKINTKNYQFMKDADMQALGLADEVGGEYLVPMAVKHSLDRYQRALTDEGSKAFLKAFDTLQSWWKRAALFSVPYHLRNDIGAKFNNWVGGMNTADIALYSSKADVEVYRAMVLGKPSKIYDEYLRQGLGASSQSKVEFKQYGEEFEKELERVLKEGSKSMGGKVATRLNPLRAFETSREVGDFFDQTNRFALYLWARNKKGLSPEKAAEKVREVQFDYTDLTGFEKDVVARVIPFYRWMKNNIPFQIRSFVNDPRKYQNMNRLRLNMQESFGIDEETQPDYMKESFALPVSGDGTGKGKMLGLNLPLGDLTKLSNPGKIFVDSLTPIGKLPLEVSMNRNFFYDKPIEKFEGDSKQFGIPGTNMDFGVPKKSAYIAEQLTGQIGRGLSGYLQKPEETNLDSKFRTPSFGISSILKDYDVNKANYYDRLEELRKLQDLMYLIEQQTGKRPPTMNDLR